MAPINIDCGLVKRDLSVSDECVQSTMLEHNAECGSVHSNAKEECITVTECSKYNSKILSTATEDVSPIVTSGQRCGRSGSDKGISDHNCHVATHASGGVMPLTPVKCFDPITVASGDRVQSTHVFSDWPTSAERSNCGDMAHWVTGESADLSTAGPPRGSYITSPQIASTCPMEIRLLPRHRIGGIPSQMNLSAWNYYLQFEDDDATRWYLHDGVKHGFAIVDDNDIISSYCCDNYSSALTGEAFQFVDNLISSELLEGKYVKASSQPHCVHALGAVPKQDGSYRPITDCRRPEGISINNHMQETFQSFNYITIDHVAANVSSGCYMATADISAAYRSVSIREDQWTYQGIRWPIEGELFPLWDVRLSFGLRCAPFIFSEMSDFVASTMKRLGFTCVANYLDDFLVFGESFEECQDAQRTLITLLGDLGFIVSWKKCTTPSTCVRYLGIIIDSEEMCLSLPDDKLSKLHSELQFFAKRDRATKKQIQRLCGIIAHCSKVIRGGRTFSRRIIDLLAGLPDGNPRIRLSSNFKSDLDWWIQFAKTFNGKEFIIFPNVGDGPMFSTDASLKGYGLLADTDWQAGYFNSDLQPGGLETCNPAHEHWLNVDVNDDTNINYLELVPIWLALKRYSKTWSNCHVVCLSDNTQVVAMLRKGHSVNKQCMVLLRSIFWICATNNIYVTTEHIQGKFNHIPDMLSRIGFSNSLSDLSFGSICCSGCD